MDGPDAKMTVRGSRNNGEKTGKRMPPVEHRFQPGNPGRPKGSRNKLGEAFIEDLHAAWQKHGMAAIEATIKNQPAQFLKVIVRVVPKDLNLHVSPYDNMTDEQLMERLRGLREQVGDLDTLPQRQISTAGPTRD
jgi:hypothetical protein